YVIHSMMRGVVMRGTASRLDDIGLGYIAGKTGTTSNYRDAWFVGYVPDLLTVAWVGFDDGTPLRMSSGEAVVPMWASYMSKTRHSSGELSPPQGVTVAQIDGMSGQLWQPACGPEITEAYLSGTEPHEMCGGGFMGDMMAGFQEPAMISEEEARAMAADAMGNMQSQVVVDPAE